MHQPIQDHLEEYLKGAANPAALNAFHQHLEACPSCREKVRRMKEQTVLFRSLQAPEELSPAPGFYGRVMDRIQAQTKVSIWSAFMEPVFARRLSYAALALLLLLGTYMVTTEPDHNIAAGPELVLVDDDPAPDLGLDQERDRNVVLVNLTSYQE